MGLLGVRAKFLAGYPEDEKIFLYQNTAILVSAVKESEKSGKFSVTEMTVKYKQATITAYTVVLGKLVQALYF